jgi:hypothetical protein
MLCVDVAGQVRRHHFNDGLAEQEEAVPELDHRTIVEDRTRGGLAVHEGPILRHPILEHPSRTATEPAPVVVRHVRIRERECEHAAAALHTSRPAVKPNLVDPLKRVRR